jgi:hypothetical protein
LAQTVNEDWFALQEAVIAEAPSHFDVDGIIATIALSCEVMRSEAQVEAVVERAADWNVSGYYIVPETPSAYLVDDPSWLANLLVLASGLKLSDKKTIVGYCNHQMLCLASADTDSIASGTWLNVRSFPPEKFYNPDDDQMSRRTTWYYCPQALSEYKLQFLDIAQRSGVLHDLAPAAGLGSHYGDPLFAGPQPTTINWGEQNAFRHYLTCLHSQVATSRQATFDDTIANHRSLLDDATSTLAITRSNGVLGQNREFYDYLDVNRSALTIYERARGARMRRAW